MPGKVPTGREAALRALYRVERDGAFLNLVLPPLVSELPPQERALAMELAAGTVRRLNTLDWSLGLFLKQPLERLTVWMRNLLRLGAYQLLYLDRIPVHAAVDEAVKLARRYGHRGVAGLANAVLRRLAAAGGDLPWPDRARSPVENLVLQSSHPKWMVERWVRRFGLEGARSLCKANNGPPPASLRPNRLRTSPAALQKRLAAEGVSAEFSPRLPGVLQAEPGGAVAALESFQEGLFTVQGESSILVPPLLEPQPGESIIDLCSAPGGKTTHLAELMDDRGMITAVDLHAHRLRLVEQAARRLKLTSIKTLRADGTRIGGAGLQSPHRILVDAPCSGLGVIRRLPELKWRRTPADLERGARLQQNLLGAAAALLRPGGALLYSVCTFEPEETAAVARAFSAAHPHFTPQPLRPLLPPGLVTEEAATGGLFLYPHLDGLDGFFIALWHRG